MITHVVSISSICVIDACALLTAGATAADCLGYFGAAAGEHEHTIIGYSLVKGIGDGEPIASERFTVGGHEWVSSSAGCALVQLPSSRVLAPLLDELDSIHPPLVDRKRQ